MSKSILVVWAHGHFGLLGTELADHQARLSAAETQTDSALEPSTRRAHIFRYCRSQPIQHEQMMEVCTSHPDEQIETSFAKTERADMARFRCVITLLFDTGSIRWESPRMPSADCVARTSNLHNIYGYDVRRFWWSDTIATLAIRLMNSSAINVQLYRF